MNRRSTLQSLATGAAIGTLAPGGIASFIPAGAASSAPTAQACSDPLLSLIAEYRAGQAAYEGAPDDLGDDEDNALAELTWRRPYARLEEACPTPTTTAGAVAGLRLVLAELEAGDDPGFIEPVLKVAVAFLEGGQI